MRKTLIFINYNIIIIIFLLLVAELAVRIFVPHIKTQGTTKGLFVDSLYYASHGLKPLSAGKSNDASVRVDKYGFREYSVSIDTSKESWLFLGDSVTFGIGVEADSTFAGIAQRRTNSTNILNPSASGYSIDNYYDVFKYFVLENKYDLKITRVSIFWCLNDIYLNMPDFKMPGGKIRHLFSDILLFMRIHSKLYYFAKTLLFDRSKSYFLFDKSFYHKNNAEFQHAIKRIVEVYDLCSEREIPFDLVLLPYEYQLRKGDFAPQNLMIKSLKDRHIVPLNPFAELSSRNCHSKSYYLYGDGVHFSKYGHKYIAEFLSDH